MILDTIDHANQYAGLNIRLDTALNAMKVYTPDNYPGGRIALDGESYSCCSTAMKHIPLKMRFVKPIVSISMSCTWLRVRKSFMSSRRNGS